MPFCHIGTLCPTQNRRAMGACLTYRIHTVMINPSRSSCGIDNIVAAKSYIVPGCSCILQANGPIYPPPALMFTGQQPDDPDMIHDGNIFIPDRLFQLLRHVFGCQRSAGGPSHFRIMVCLIACILAVFVTGKRHSQVH